MFGGLGLPELVVIGVAALLVFGPRRLPELAKSLGKGIRDFKKALEGGGSDDESSEESKKLLDSQKSAQSTIPRGESRPESAKTGGSDGDHSGKS